MTYETFFELKDKPFRLSPDTEYFFPSDVHKEVMRHLLYSISSEEGFVEISGEPGIGKTITVRSLLKQIGEDVQISLIVNPTIGPRELLLAVVSDFGLPADRMQKLSGERILRLLQQRLIQLEDDKVSVIIIDEAQNLSDETLEQLCLISNIETEKKKLVKIVLVGQLELGKNLQRPELKKIYQRITVRCRLNPLSKQDMVAYIQHRIRVAGGAGHHQPRFSKQIYHLIYTYSEGLPRVINLICERSLMAAFAEQKRQITRSHLKKAINSFHHEEALTHNYKRAERNRWMLIALLVIVSMLFCYELMTNTPIYRQFFFSSPVSQHTDSQKDLLQPIDPSNRATDVDTSMKPLANSSQAVTPINATVENSALQKTVSVEKDTSQENSVSAIRSPEDSTINNTKQTQDTKISKTTHIRPQPSDAVSTPLTQRFPEPLISLADDQHVIIFHTDTNDVSLWKGPSKQPKFIQTGKFYANLREGLYILGKDKKDQPFLFNPYVLNTDNDVAVKLFHQLKPISTERAVPLLVYLSIKSFPETIYEKTEQLEALVSRWAESWRSKDILNYMQFYRKDDILFYNPDRKPQKISWEKLNHLKTTAFSKVSQMMLTLSNPIAIIDPGNPKAAVALFFQRYSAGTYADQGIKVLFLNQEYNSEPLLSKQAAKPIMDWRIIGRLWMATKE
ncbi:MAG: AAA family ATPase [Candidatus Magnetomorum sp.]|nr:AAA family ATPase [Candidatus Magnetomorum sp.]